jgi:XTP/dITP diphosphohydrolase
MTLIFATNNQHKLFEIRRLTQKKISISGLSEAGFNEEIPEDYPTLEQNASQKAWYIYSRMHQNCFADDTGLEVEALDGAPGVYSARFSKIGEITYPDMEVSEGNIRKLLELMRNAENRKARFRTVISLILDGTEYQFEGSVSGIIAKEKMGKDGFGYDPVFIPYGEVCSFAKMDMDRKNGMSHRGRAVEKMMEFLNLQGFTNLEGI